MSKQITVGISVGDLNGIGLEIVLKCLSNKDLIKEITPVIYASKAACNFYKQLFNLEDFEFISIDDHSKIKKNKVNIINVWTEDVKIEPGTPTRVSGEKAFESLKAAVNGLASNHVDVLVTAPIDKKNIQSKDFNFPGHTEYLAKMANVEEALMFLVSDKLRVGVVTGHIPLQDVSKNISKDAILNKVIQMDKSLRNDFGIGRPKIAVLGLNPHAGDNGVIGKEDQEIIRPAIEAANAKGITTIGPYPADGLFGSSGYAKFDGILAMYHDQGLIPFKAISFGSGVNFTAGLPIVRTSPDHGTAFDIAGKNLANPDSFRQAIYTAVDIFNTRKEERSLQSDPLETSKGRKDRY
ncbi:MAG: 4-hydroxythreonine-4-phosphate dehydrogenase [Patiriisocius sp.]|jgi:4-hydroxythreonine-4-phosphate dehydrogenase